MDSGGGTAPCRGAAWRTGGFYAYESYRGRSIHVWTVGNVQFHWCFTVDHLITRDGYDVSFADERAALEAGREHARAWVDSRMAHTTT